MISLHMEMDTALASLIETSLDGFSDPTQNKITWNVLPSMFSYFCDILERKDMTGDLQNVTKTRPCVRRLENIKILRQFLQLLQDLFTT